LLSSTRKHWGYKHENRNAVAALMLTGASTKQIVGQLNISLSTVNWHKKRIFHSANVHDRYEYMAKMMVPRCKDE